jgi:hypothetical protein
MFHAMKCAVAQQMAFLLTLALLSVSVCALAIFEATTDFILSFQLRALISAVHHIESFVDILSRWLDRAFEKCADLEAWAVSFDLRSSHGEYKGANFYPASYANYDRLLSINTRMAWGTTQPRIKAHYARFVKDSSSKTRTIAYRHVEVGLASPKYISAVSSKAACLLVDVDPTWLNRGSSVLAELGYAKVSTLLHDISTPLPTSDGYTASAQDTGSSLFGPVVQGFGKVAGSLLSRTPKEQSTSEDISSKVTAPGDLPAEAQESEAHDASHAHVLKAWTGTADSIALNYVLHCVPGTLAPGTYLIVTDHLQSCLMCVSSQSCIICRQ